MTSISAVCHQFVPIVRGSLNHSFRGTIPLPAVCLSEDSHVNSTRKLLKTCSIPFLSYSAIAEPERWTEIQPTRWKLLVRCSARNSTMHRQWLTLTVQRRCTRSIGRRFGGDLRGLWRKSFHQIGSSSSHVFITRLWIAWSSIIIIIVIIVVGFKIRRAFCVQTALPRGDRVSNRF